MLTCRK